MDDLIGLPPIKSEAVRGVSLDALSSLLGKHSLTNVIAWKKSRSIVELLV